MHRWYNRCIWCIVHSTVKRPAYTGKNWTKSTQPWLSLISFCWRMMHTYDAAFYTSINTFLLSSCRFSVALFFFRWIKSVDILKQYWKLEPNMKFIFGFSAKVVWNRCLDLCIHFRLGQKSWANRSLVFMPCLKMHRSIKFIKSFWRLEFISFQSAHCT